MASYTQLILGCGYLGQHLLTHFAPGTTLAVTRSAARHADLSARGATPLAIDLVTERGVLQRALGAFRGTVWVLLPPSAFGADAEATVAALVAELEAAPTLRGILASSTAVYGECQGGRVTAATPAAGSGARAERLLAIEAAWRSARFPTGVLRLAGLYGPGRVVGQGSVLSGETLPGSGEAWLNLVRIEDAALALHAAGSADSAWLAGDGVGLIADGTPVLRRDYYTHLAALLGAAPPRFEGSGGRDGGSRQCDPRTTWAALGVAPHYPGYRAGLADLV